jgi:hypothetical protein
MHTGSYVNGTWYHPASTEITRNINPADTADVIAEFPLATAADVDRAIGAATAAWTAWRKTPGPERGRVLSRAAEISRRRVRQATIRKGRRWRQSTTAPKIPRGRFIGTQIGGPAISCDLEHAMECPQTLPPGQTAPDFAALNPGCLLRVLVLAASPD